MESSAQEAIDIGISVLIFIVALSAAIILLTSVLNMSELANDIIKDTTGSALMTQFGETNERIYTGDEMLALIGECLAETNQLSDRIKLKIKEGHYVEEVDNSFTMTTSALESQYILKYDGVESDKAVYIFEKM